MKLYLGGKYRQLIVGLTVAVALAAVILLLGLTRAARADLAALKSSTKTASPDVVFPGDLITYTIIVSNTGETITDTVLITDVLPSPVDYVSHAAPTGVISGTDSTDRVITFTLPMGLGDGESVDLEVVVQVGAEITPGTIFTNAAVIDDGTTIVEPFVRVTVHGHTYLPIIMKRWPPVPYAPTLEDPIEVIGDDLTVSWDYVSGAPAVPDPDHYHLQRASDLAFSDISENYEPVTSPTILPDVPVGMWYFRVRGHNSYGYGEWSNVVPVDTGYIDEFSDPASGWYVGSAERWNLRYFDDVSVWRLETVAYMSYVPEHYRIEVPLHVGGGGDVDTWFVWPAQMAPLAQEAAPLPDSYCVEARAIFANSTGADSPYWAHWGIVFGANSSESDSTLTEIYTFQVNSSYKLGILRYQNYVYPGNRQPLDGSFVNVETSLYNWPSSINHWSEQGYGNPANQYNTLKVWVHGDRVDVYINGARIVTANIPGMPRAGVGVIAGDWEITPVITDFDYFRYDPNCTGP